MTNMVYCIPKSTITEFNLDDDVKKPSNKRMVNEYSQFIDLDKNKWNLFRIENGFIINYVGNQSQRPSTFTIEKDGEYFEIKNTYCLFINTVDFEMYYEIRETIRKNNTDFIWDYFQELIQDRFLSSNQVLESEKLK